MIGKDGNFYVARKDPSGAHVNPKLVKNKELLKQILENPQNYNNKHIEQLYKETEEQKADRLTTQYAGYGGGYVNSG
jgi:CRISPR/Cas system CSM-associated protein Csm5 (group 7 of RAMP superfamily)